MTIPEPQHENLASFLSSHHHLRWLHDIHLKSFYQVKHLYMIEKKVIPKLDQNLHQILALKGFRGFYENQNVFPVTAVI